MKVKGRAWDIVDNTLLKDTKVILLKEAYVSYLLLIHSFLEMLTLDSIYWYKWQFWNKYPYLEKEFAILSLILILEDKLWWSNENFTNRRVCSLVRIKFLSFSFTLRLVNFIYLQIEGHRFFDLFAFVNYWVTNYFFISWW